MAGIGQNEHLLREQFWKSSKSDNKLLGWGGVEGRVGWGGGVGVISKDLKSSHQTGQGFHNSYNNDIQFPLCFLYQNCSSTTASTVIECDVIIT